MRLWQRVTELSDGLGESEETTVLSLLSRMQQLEYAWRLGMDRAQAEALGAETAEIAGRIGDLRSLALLKLLTSVRPGVAEHTGEWADAADEAIRLADESGEPGLRAACRGAAAYVHMCAGDLDRLEARIDEMFAILDGDPDLGAGIVIGSPIAWGRMAKAVALRERGRTGEADRLLDQALEEATERGDPETESWVLSSKATVLAENGEIEAALALALRNRELTERLGDVFSRTMSLSSLAYVRLEAGEFSAALEAIELAEAGYREAMGSGGETEGWRATLRARALLGLDRTEEAMAQAEWAADTARRRGMGWQLPAALLVLAQAQAAAGRPGVAEALDEAAAMASSNGHRAMLRRLEGEREELAAV
jgi:tetratricopeptide (TPR) repeat protein